MVEPVDEIFGGTLPQAPDIQNIIMVDYVRRGNEMISTALSGLQSALEVTNNVLSTLASIQTLHNQVSISDASSLFTMPVRSAGETESAFLVRYKALASAFFGTPIDPIIAADGLTVIKSAVNVPSFYGGGTVSMATVVGYSASQALISSYFTIRANLLSEIQLLSSFAGSSGNDLLVQLRQVYSSMPDVTYDAANYVDSRTAGFRIKNWLLDNYDQHGTAGATTSGQIQSQLATAITAAEHLNDTNKVEVQKFMQLFEQFYKSASAMLTAINDIITKMARGIQ